MKHLLYRVTNLLNKRFYIGMHSTKNVDDGYLGSGRRIQAEVKKYGRENFKKEILEVLPSRKALEEREAEVVNENLLEDPLCLNLKNGGEGGGRFWSKEQQLNCATAGGKALAEKRKDEKFLIRYQKNHRNGLIRAMNSEDVRSNLKPHLGFVGKHHTDSTKKKWKISRAGKQDGKKNSQFGTIWVTNGVKAIKIDKDQLYEYEMQGYSRGRKIVADKPS